MSIFLIVIAMLLQPVPAIAYREYQSELVAGNLIIQDQFFSSRTVQNLFHRQGEADRDIEAFALTGTPDGGVASSQASSAASEGFEEGYFNSTSTSTMIPPAPIGIGFLGTTIGDPITTGTMLGSGLSWPTMAQADPAILAPKPTKVPAPASKNVTTNKTTGNKTTGNKTVTGNKSKLELVDIISPASGNNTTSSNATKAIPSANKSTNATKKPAGKNETKAKKPDELIKSGDPFSRQPNRPFIMALTYPSGPIKAKREKVANMSSWDRYRMNVIGRSTTDKGYNGSTSYPYEMTPWNSIAPLPPYEFLENASMMTAQGTVLSNRQWLL